ncbi:MAG TPA: RDD family protein [Albitalea sp.]|nr:RDD family protein [Albitalea sp.]
MSVSLDTLFTAETPEGIALALRPAGVMPRLYAYAIDLGIRLAVIVTATSVLAAMGRFGQGIFMILLFGLEWFYPVLFELTLSGATPGKRAMGLRVVMDSGLPVTPAASLLRNLLRAADFMPLAYGFGFAAMLLRADFKRLGDLAAGTLVVYAKTVALHGPLPEAAPLAPSRPLSPREQAAVIAWAGRSARLTEARLAELAQLAAPVCNGTSSKDTTLRLLGVAQWLLGKR